MLNKNVFIFKKINNIIYFDFYRNKYNTNIVRFIQFIILCVIYVIVYQHKFKLCVCIVEIIKYYPSIFTEINY